MFNTNRWKIYNKVNIDLLPNTMLLINYINNKYLNIKYLNNINDLNFVNLRENKKIATISKYDKKNTTNANLWLSNVKMMNEFSKNNGWEYFVFLQPTMGLKGVQSNAPDRTNDRIILDEAEKSQVYLNKINSLYDDLKIHCKKLDFCFDISDIAPPIGDHYNDKRHHNSKGNFVIASEIYKILKNK